MMKKMQGAMGQQPGKGKKGKKKRGLGLRSLPGMNGMSISDLKGLEDLLK